MSLDWSLLWPPFAAGALVLATHVPLGRVVLARGIIFLDLAVAQIATLGVIVAELLHLEQSWEVQLCALAGALLGALVLHGLERRWPDVLEALIGVGFVLAASAAMLLLSHEPHGAEHIKDLLSGQLLWVLPDQLVPAAIAYALLGVIWRVVGVEPGSRGYYLIFAAAVTISVQLVGVYLVFASLIIPALAVRRLAARMALLVGFGLGASAYAVALIASSWYDLPSGPLVVWTLAVCGGLTGFLRYLSLER